MKKITLWLFALFTCWQISAQTGTVVVGVNDGTPNTSSGVPSPLQDYYKTQRMQILYTAAELSGAGLVAGNITEIGWVATALNASTLQENYTISMKSTASTVLTGTFETGATVVYGPADFTPSATGNVMFTLTTPFVWDGTSNVIIELCAGLASGAWSENVSCANSTTAGIQTVYNVSDSATAPCTQATGTTTTQRPLLVATGNVASCLAPLNIVFNNVTSSTADISWDPVSPVPGIGYEYVVSTSNVAPTGAGTATIPVFASLTGLNPQTTYYIFVRSNCSTGVFSGWNGPVSFTTNCTSVTSFVENFDAVTTPAFPNCWAKVGAGGTTNTQTGSANSAPNTMYFASFSTTSLAVVSTQQVSNLGAGTNRIKFDMRANFTVGGVVEFGYLTDPTDATTFVSLTTFTASALTYSTYQYSPPAGSYSDYPAFRHTGSPGNSVLIDNVVWEANPACADQTGVVFSAVTSSGADTSWDAITGAVGYEYAVTTSATPPASGTSTTNTFYIATGLAPQTLYYIHVRPMCSPGVYGNWASNSFTTACVAITTLPWNEGFEGLTTVGANNFPACWFKENGDWSSQNTNDAYSTANTGTKFIRDSWSATNEYVWTPGFDLVAGTSYDFSSFVQGDNETGWVVDYFVNSSQVSTGATQLGGSYNVPGTGTPYAFQPYAQVTRSFVPATSGTYYFAVRVNQPSGDPWYVTFDDFKLDLSPACPTPNASASAVTDVTANLTWAAVPSATIGYEYVLDNVATDPAVAGTPTTAISYPASGLTQLTTYYFHIRSVCAVGTYSTWSTISFTTLATPPANDNCLNAIALNVNADYLCGDFVSGTTVGATNSGVEPALAVSGTPDNDVWYSFVATHAAHRITLTNVVAVTGTSVDMGIGVYNGPCASLTLVGSSDPNTYNLTGLTPGNTYLVNVYGWYANGVTEANATFNICVGTDPVLSSVSFDKSSFVAYPNPVKDVLNLSYKTEISNVRIINLLGQEVLNTKTNTNDVQVNMSALTAGAYIVNITVEDTVHTIKVIKE